MHIFNKPITILYLLLSILLISIAFQNCSSPFEANSVNGTNLEFRANDGDEATMNELKSLVIFEETLYNDLQQNCASCHGTVQKPLFAVDNSLDSHRFLFNQALVNLETPENSFLAIQIRSGHNDIPPELADQFVATIRDWSTQLQAVVEVPEENLEEDPPEEPAEEQPPVVVQPPAPIPAEPEPKESETFAYINANILALKCVRCHRPSEEGGFGLKDNYTSFATTMAGTSVVPGDAEASPLYQEVLAGKMPPGSPLAEDEIASIKAWIDQGAKNN